MGTTERKARLYDSHRLPYAPEALAPLLDAAKDRRMAVDIGAGTGQLARLLSPHFGSVVAVEPDPAMVAVACEVLKPLENVTVVEAAAEATDLPDGCADLIVLGNAYHRLSPEAPSELLRVRSADAPVALVGYELPQEFSSLLFGKLAKLPGLAARTSTSWVKLPTTALFGDAPLQSTAAELTVTEDWEEFFGGACSGIEAPEPGDEEFVDFERINREVFDQLASNGRLQLTYRTVVQFGWPS